MDTLKSIRHQTFAFNVVNKYLTPKSVPVLCNRNCSTLCIIYASALWRHNPNIQELWSKGLPQICQLRIGTDAQGLGVGADGIDVAAWMKLRTSYRLSVLQRGNWNKPGPSRIALAIAVRSREWLQHRRQEDGVRHVLKQTHRWIRICSTLLFRFRTLD